MPGTSRIHVRVPTPLLRDFRKLFPYHGELTGFILRCIEMAVRKGGLLEEKEVDLAGKLTKEDHE